VQILEKVFEGSSTARVATLLFDLRDAT